MLAIDVYRILLRLIAVTAAGHTMSRQHLKLEMWDLNQKLMQYGLDYFDKQMKPVKCDSCGNDWTGRAAPMLTDEGWSALGYSATDKICDDCVRQRLGREYLPSDFAENILNMPWIREGAAEALERFGQAHPEAMAKALEIFGSDAKWTPIH